jgi:hypothetical protein
MKLAWNVITGISFGIQQYDCAGITVPCGDENNEFVECLEGPAIEITFLCFSLMVVFV